MLVEFLSALPLLFVGRLNLVVAIVTGFGSSATLNTVGLLIMSVMRLRSPNLRRNFSYPIAGFGLGAHHNIT
jgi:hypothetical protein